MSLHPVLLEKLNTAVLPTTAPLGTRRDTPLVQLPGKATAVVGMRRAGKSTLVRQHVEQLRAALPPERAVYLSLDDDRLTGIGVEQLAFLLEEYYRRFPALRGRDDVHLFLDEVQLVDGWERFVRRVLDTERMVVVVSGSSARMLSREVHTSLRGRGLATVVRPFSFREYLRHRGEEPSEPATHFTAAQRSAIEQRFREFLVEGGFPEVQGLPAPLRIEILQGYVDTVLFRDVVERYGVTNLTALRWLTRHVLRNPAGTFSVHRLHQDLRSQGVAGSRELVHELLGHLVDAFLVTPVFLATESERRRNSNPRKLQLADPGLVRAFDASARSNVGHTLETVVANELFRRGADVSYVRTEGGFEVDFLARFADGSEELIQVCADLADPGTRERELRALAAASTEHPRATQRMLVLDRDAASLVRADAVSVQPTYEWLLDGYADV
jgi:hypothetical protein